jgi:hypothetical protein
MRRNFVVAFFTLALLAAGACAGGGEQPTGGGGAAQPAAEMTPAALPDNGFKAQITLPDPPAKLRAGQQERIQVKVKNASDVIWYARGAPINTSSSNKFYIAAGNRWLKADDNSLVTDMDGRHGIPRDLQPGEEGEVLLLITAPKDPGDYLLEVDLVQEQVGWFSDKGSPTAKAKISVVK